MGPRRRELVELAEFVGNHLRGSVADQVRRTVVSLRDPRARLLRRRRRARRASRTWAAIGLTTGSTAGVVLATGTTVGVTGYGLAATALVTGALAVRSGVHSVRLHRAPLPEALFVPRTLPPARSRARQPMERLALAERSLDELLRQLAGPHGGIAPVPPDSIAHVRTTAAAAVAALEAVAAQLAAVERARDIAPPTERAALSDGVGRLRTQLDGGVEGYGSLVAAAGRAVVASQTSDPWLALTEATDHLAGVASALRDLPRGRSA